MVNGGDSGSRDGNGDPSFAPPLLEQESCVWRSRRGQVMGFKRKFKRAQDKRGSVPPGFATAGVWCGDLSVVTFKCGLCGFEEDLAEDLYRVLIMLFGKAICQGCLAATLAENFLPKEEEKDRPGLADGGRVLGRGTDEV